MQARALFCAILAITVCAVCSQTLHEIYRLGGVLDPNGPALIAEGPTFTLNGKEFRIISGAVHYFRIVPEYWQDRLRKLKANGLNTVETYVPWNLHEARQSEFNFTGMLDIRKFIQLAQQEDLFVILRPGPYICSEWDFGGLPSWLLRTQDIEVRTMDPAFVTRVTNYFSELIPRVTDLQFTYGGPIIQVQVENEYGGFGGVDPPYLLYVRDLLVSLGVIESFVTSDTPSINGDKGAIPGVLMAANFDENPERQFEFLLELQPNRPLLVMEWWDGWFDYWGREHNTMDVATFSDILTRILDYNSSINFYMYHGGTSFGFMSGANSDPFSQIGIYMPDVSSYDYDAPLSESGDYTEKYFALGEIVSNYTKGKLWDVPLPPHPELINKTAYGEILLTEYLPLQDLLPYVEVVRGNLLPMELLPINAGSGQLHGFTLYSAAITINDSGSIITINGHVRDRALIILGGKLLAIFDWHNRNDIINVDSSFAGEQTLQIFVENLGRVNFGHQPQFRFQQQAKGLLDPVLIDDVEIVNWEIYPFEFEKSFIDKLPTATWQPFNNETANYPALIKGNLNIAGTPTDTFLNLQGHTKGIVLLNGFNLGRYWEIGPQRTLYVPAPLLKSGDNEVLVFEVERNVASVISQDFAILAG